MSTPPKRTVDIKSQFDKNSAPYEKLTGGSTRRIAEACLQWLPPLSSSLRILDNACGPGIVTRLILDRASELGVVPPPHITAIDFAPGMISQLEIHKSELEWNTVESRVLDAQRLEGIANDNFDAIFMNFGIFTLPNAELGAREMQRVLKPGGTAIVTTWKILGVVDLLVRAVRAIRPEDEWRVFPVSKDWFTAEKVTNTMISGGFEESKVHLHVVRSTWQSSSIEELVDAMSGPFWERIWECWTEEEKGRWRSEVERQMTEKERSECSLDVVAWVCVAVK
jgi:ubiquinone/menaquinone biosynthesis C-methylase UbiE